MFYGVDKNKDTDVNTQNNMLSGNGINGSRMLLVVVGVAKGRLLTGSCGDVSSCGCGDS